MRRQFSKAEEELGIHHQELASAPAPELEAGAPPMTRGARVLPKQRIPARKELHLNELARTGFYFCKGCDKVVKLIETSAMDVELGLPMRKHCEFNPEHTVENQRVEWVPPV